MPVRPSERTSYLFACGTAGRVRPARPDGGSPTNVSRSLQKRPPQNAAATDVYVAHSWRFTGCSRQRRENIFAGLRADGVKCPATYWDKPGCDGPLPKIIAEAVLVGRSEAAYGAECRTSRCPLAGTVPQRSPAGLKLGRARGALEGAKSHTLDDASRAGLTSAAATGLPRTQNRPRC
jgi:hypothetical protein